MGRGGGEWKGSLASSPVLSFSPSNSSGARLHAKRSLECIHSLQTHPEEDQRWTRESDTELEPAAGASAGAAGASLSCPLLREAGAPFPSQLGPQDPDSAQGRLYLLLRTWLGQGAGSGATPSSTLSLRVALLS